MRVSARSIRGAPSVALAGFGAALCLALLVRAQAARAVILPARTIDGPSENIVGFGGAAMAEDGTGGVAYLKRVEGVPHVFVSRYVGGSFQPPVRVDTEEPFAASWLRIGAAENGELIVVWATPFATENGRPIYELLGSELGPGSQTFGRAAIIDPDIREATGTSPALAVSSTGQAVVAYRVVNFESTIPLLRPGDVVESVRAAGFDGERWSSMGTLNRAPGLSMRPPSAANAPAAAIGPTGNGIIAWQEPESTGVARIWARRFFGLTLNYVMPATATTYNGAPITTDADAPSVAFTRLGQAELAYRQNYAAGSPLPGPRIYVNTLSDGESESGAEFLGPNIADAAGAGGRTTTVGRPSIDVNERREVRLLYDSNGRPQVVRFNDKGIEAASAFGSPFTGSLLGAAGEIGSGSVMNPEGGGVSAWPSADAHGRPAVAAREDFPSGAVQTAILSGGAGGPIGELAVGRSGLGDGLVAFQQGPLGNAAIVGAQITAPPEPFAETLPKGWVRPKGVQLAWAPSETANGPLSYRVFLDGRTLTGPLSGTGYTFGRGQLSTGTHEVQVMATDIFGQSVLTATGTLKVDGRAPTLQLSRSGRVVVLHLRDLGAGLAAGSVKVSFGDGSHGRRRATLAHRYAHAGTYGIRVMARDKAGNVLQISRRVRVR